MREEKLLRAMGSIKEEYIEESAELLPDAKGAKAVPEAETIIEKRKPTGRWRTWAAAAAAVFALCLAVGGMSMRGMGKSASQSAGTDSFYFEFSENGGMGRGDSGHEYPGSADGMYMAENALSASDGEKNSASAPTVSGVFQPANVVKLIRRADMTIQTLEFEEAEKALYALVEQLGGYFESSDVYNGEYNYGSEYKNGNYIIRIPADKYGEFIKTAGAGYHISQLSESVEDIGQQYFDTETRLSTLRTKLARLQELLKKAKDLSDIIQLESAISDTEYQIDMYTSTLNRYDSLVGYATINLSLQKVSRVGDAIDQDNGFFAQLARSFRRGILSFADGLGDIINWAAFNSISIIIIIAVVLIVKKKGLVRKLFGRLHKKDR